MSATFVMPIWLDAVLTALLVVGAVFALIGSWGLAKLSNFYKRLHGPTKATTLGVGCVLIASALYFSVRHNTVSLHEFLISVFLFLTAPVSAHLLIRASLKIDAHHRPPLPGHAERERNIPNTPLAGKGRRPISKC